MTEAVFHKFGYIRCSNDKLKSFDKGLPIDLLVYFDIWFLMSSGPVALLTFNSFLSRSRKRMLYRISEINQGLSFSRIKTFLDSMHALHNSLNLLEKCSQPSSTEEDSLILAQLSSSVRLLRVV